MPKIVCKTPKYNFMKKEEKPFEIADTWLYQVFIKSANRLLHKPLALLEMAKKAVAKLQEYDSIKEIALDAKAQIGTIVRLVKAYAMGDYREISNRNLIFSVAALIYLVSPLDIIPDFLVVGWADDVTLLMWVYSNFKSEMEAFLDWEDRDKRKIEIWEDRIKLK